MSLLSDVRFAIRSLLRRPAFTATAAGILALGIGANTAIFSVVDAVLLRSLPYSEPARLVVVFSEGRLCEGLKCGLVDVLEFWIARFCRCG